MKSLERRVRRLEKVVWPGGVKPVLDPRIAAAGDDLLKRIDARYVEALEAEFQCAHDAKKERKRFLMSSLMLGYASTVCNHMTLGTPLEFPACVAEAYARIGQNSPIRLVACVSCGYEFPAYGNGGPFTKCVLCGEGVRTQNL